MNLRQQYTQARKHLEHSPLAFVQRASMQTVFAFCDAIDQVCTQQQAGLDRQQAMLKPPIDCLTALAQAAPDRTIVIPAPVDLPDGESLRIDRAEDGTFTVRIMADDDPSLATPLPPSTTTAQ